MQGTRSKASFLALIVDVEFAETDTSFLTSETFDIYLQSVLFYYNCNT